MMGCFVGSVAGPVPLAAAMSGMERRRFVIWNVSGSFSYTLANVAIGGFLGEVLDRIGGSLARSAERSDLLYRPNPRVAKGLLQRWPASIFRAPRATPAPGEQPSSSAIHRPSVHLTDP